MSYKINNPFENNLKKNKIKYKIKLNLLNSKIL